MGSALRYPSVLAIANQKGGVAKTTTAVNLSVSLASKQRRVLLIDFDYQCNAGAYLNVNHLARSRGADIYAALTDRKSIDECIQPTTLDGVDVIAGSIALSTYWKECFSSLANVLKLRNLIKNSTHIKKTYDLVILDTHPSLDPLFDVAMHASNYYLVPVFAEVDAFEGLGYLMKKIEEIKEFDGVSRQLYFLGLVVTRFIKKNRTHQRFLEFLEKYCTSQPYSIRGVIPSSDAVAASSAAHSPLLQYAPNLNVTLSYEELATDLRKDLKGPRKGRAQSAPSLTGLDHQSVMDIFSEEETF